MAYKALYRAFRPQTLGELVRQEHIVRILQNQTKEDAFIYWEDDPVIAEQLKHIKVEAQMMPFAENYEDGACAYKENGMLTFHPKGHAPFDMPANQLSLHGLHNLYNSMAAGLSASLLDIRKDVIRKALSDFESVEHRLEYVETIDGVRYINDSKATNVNSCWYALESMNTPVVLILGGKDKGNDYTEIEQLVKDKVKAIVCMGKDKMGRISFSMKDVPAEA